MAREQERRAEEQVRRVFIVRGVHVHWPDMLSRRRRIEFPIHESDFEHFRYRHARDDRKSCEIICMEVRREEVLQNGRDGGLVKRKAFQVAQLRAVMKLAGDLPASREVLRRHFRKSRPLAAIDIYLQHEIALAGFAESADDVGKPCRTRNHAQLVDRLLAKIEARMCEGRTLDRVVELNDILAKLGEGKVAAYIVEMPQEMTMLTSLKSSMNT